MLDTNVLVAALRSSGGASYALTSSAPSALWSPVLSVPLYLEYQEVLLRPGTVPAALTPDDIRAFCRYIASISHLQDVFFLWRPLLSDPEDDMVLELAVAAQARYIITHNVSDFRAATELGVTPVRPADFLRILRGTP